MKHILRMLFFVVLLGLSQISFASEIERARKLAGQGKYITSTPGKTIIKNVYLSGEDQRIALNKAADKTEEEISNARLVMIQAQSQFLDDKIFEDKFDEIIYEQSSTIARAEQNLKNEIEVIVAGKKISSIQEGYLSQLRKSWMAWSGYEVTKEQKETRENIDLLIRQKEIVKDEYDLVRLDQGLEPEKKDSLQARYKTVIARIDNEISQQQVAMSDKWSLLKKGLVAGAVAAAVTVAGLLFNKPKWLAIQVE